MIAGWLILSGGAYLIGAIPFGLILGLLRGVDIRQHGSGNIGATNAGRVLGKSWGHACLVLDILKGLGPTLAARAWLGAATESSVGMLAWISVGLAAVLGHLFPVYLGFRGGKGVATTIGVALAIFPVYTASITVALIGYALFRFGTGYVSAGSLALATLFPLAVAAYVGWSGRRFADCWPLLAVALLLGMLIIVRHRANIVRLWQGRESRADHASGQASS